MAANISSLSIINSKTIVLVKFADITNLVWKQVLLNALESFGVASFVDGTVTIPPQFIESSNKRLVVNLEDTIWNKEDTTILTWINATLSLSILQMLISTHNRS